ncbi:MFS transporter [Actinacidiphila bryophytorum]|uniref:MFS transporter n=1 Tax=Actinacidiphila bryophytorum TaxID=1436133 RepID=UPI002176D7CF|nr:MFS transporter [Actinacidiphila bryophytorum]UWE07515.1 MFS transporter [Actinacidiphila bryophytorum]
MPPVAVPAAPVPASPAPERESVRGRAVAVAVVMLAVAMDLVDTSAVNVALPSLQAGFSLSSAGVQWLVAGYSLPFAVLLITGGRLGDVIGYRRAFLLGTGGFLAASLVCAFAPGAAVLTGGRVAQGAAAALMVPQATSLLQLMYAPRERARVMGLFGALAGLAAAFGPLVGGALLRAGLPGADWRPIFLLNVPISLAALAAGAALLPPGGSPERVRLDLRGTALAVGGLVLLVLPLIQGPSLHWPLWCVLSPVAALPVLALLARDQVARAGRPGGTLVDPGLFRHRSFRAGLLLSLLVEAVMAGLLLSATLTLQAGLGMSALAAALTTLPMIAGMVVGVAALAEPLVPRLGRNVITAGCATLAAGAAGTAWVLHHYGDATHGWQLAPTLLLTGTGLGMLMGPLFAITLQHVPPARAGSASGVLESVEQLGGVLGVVSVGTVFLHTSASRGYVPGFAWAAAAALALLAVTAAAVPALPRHFRSEEELGLEP